MKTVVPVPPLSWWRDQGLPIAEIPVLKRDIKQLEPDEKVVAAAATFPLLIKALIKAAVVFLIILAGIVAVLIMNSMDSAASGTNSGLDSMLLYILIICGCCLFGIVIGARTAALIQGFDLVNSGNKLGLPMWFRLIKYFVSAPTMLLGELGCLFLQIIGRMSQSKMLGLPRIGLPRNGSFDDLIDYYSVYERHAIIKAKAESFVHYNLPQLNDEITEVKETIKAIEKDDNRAFSERQIELNEWKELLKKAEELKEEMENV